MNPEQQPGLSQTLAEEITAKEQSAKNIKAK